ncbi:hypothetical protein CEXT_783941 [Caerostris extrusa]|uniref:Uncharacterized protein n=1 Tax=Caerostris extrusa TaxID=172846 RepID=A0AAV4NRD8_CAEEX|nr:hypothetical protein CEXT_783941 [Caerostris extrusa]
MEECHCMKQVECAEMLLKYGAYKVHFISNQSRTLMQKKDFEGANNFMQLLLEIAQFVWNYFYKQFLRLDAHPEDYTKLTEAITIHSIYSQQNKIRIFDCHM